MSNSVNNEFDNKISRFTKSAAYLDYCEEVYGYRMYLFNMTDRAQLDYIFNEIPVLRSDTVLDIGCGSGSVLNHIVRKSGCRGIGIDLLDRGVVSIENENTKYLCENVDDTEIKAIQPTVTLLVDSIYFCGSPEKLLKDLCNISGNRIYLFYSQYLFDGSVDNRHSLRGDNTKVAEILKKISVTYQFIDYSKNERSLYENSISALIKRKKEFYAEGNSELFEEKMSEQLLGKQLYDAGKASRYLYRFSAK